MDTWKSEELISEWHRNLKATGMPEGQALRHRDELRFFLHAYLKEEWPRPIERTDGTILRDYLGSWFLSYVGGSKSDILGRLITFRRFFDFLYQSGRITDDEYYDVIDTCESRDYFSDAYDDFTRPMPDAWEDFAAGGPLRESAINMGYETPIDRQLWMLVKNMDRPDAAVVTDFTLFLDYVGTEGIELNRKNRRIPRAHVVRINKRFGTPEDLPPRHGMDASRRVMWFYWLSLALGLCERTGDNVFRTTKKAEAFLDLGPETRLAVIIENTWNGLGWEKLGTADSERISRWAQEHRGGFAALLAELIPNRDWNLDPDPDLDRNDALLARYILFHDVVENNVLFCLSECGLVSYNCWNTDGEPRMMIKSMSTSRFGRQVFALFARQASRQGPKWTDPLEQLQECLFV